MGNVSEIEGSRRAKHRLRFSYDGIAGNPTGGLDVHVHGAGGCSACCSRSQVVAGGPLLVDIRAWLIHPLTLSAGMSVAYWFANVLVAAIPKDKIWGVPLLLREHLQTVSFPIQAIIAVVACCWGPVCSGFASVGTAPYSLPITAVSYGLGGLAVLVWSRFRLAVPAVILDDYGARQALFRSDKLTQGKWLTLSALSSEVLYRRVILRPSARSWLATFIHVSVPLPSWFPWILTIVSMICVTVVEPTMFVGRSALLEDVGPRFLSE